MAQVSYTNIEDGRILALDKAYMVLPSSKERVCTGSRFISVNERYLITAQR